MVGVAVGFVVEADRAKLRQDIALDAASAISWLKRREEVVVPSRPFEFTSTATPLALVAPMMPAAGLFIPECRNRASQKLHQSEDGC